MFANFHTVGGSHRGEFGETYEEGILAVVEMLGRRRSRFAAKEGVLKLLWVAQNRKPLAWVRILAPEASGRRLSESAAGLAALARGAPSRLQGGRQTR